MIMLPVTKFLTPKTFRLLKTLIEIGCFHHFDRKRRKILSLERIKQSKQDLLTFASDLPCTAAVIVVFSTNFPFLKNTIRIKPTSISGDHKNDFQE